MARYAILNTVDWEGCRSLGSGEAVEEEIMRRLTGCAWLFRVRDGLDDVEEAARAAIAEYYSDPAGQLVLRRESLARLSWEEAVAWVPEEVWSRHGLEPVYHPGVERVILDANEDLTGSVRPSAAGDRRPGTQPAAP